jgi:hypothetical protein
VKEIQSDLHSGVHWQKPRGCARHCPRSRPLSLNTISSLDSFMPRKRASKIRRAIQAAEYEQERNLRREANAQRRVAIQPQAIPPQVAEPQVAEPHVAEPQVAEPQVAEPQVAEPHVAEPQVAEPHVAEPQVAEPQVAKPQVIPEKVYNWIQDLYRKIAPQLLPPIAILIQQATGNYQDQNVIQPGPFQQALVDEDDILQLMHVDEA